MPSRTEAQAAIDGLNGKELKGRTLTVNEAPPLKVLEAEDSVAADDAPSK